MRRHHYFLLLLIALAGACVVWLFFFHPSCYVYRTVTENRVSVEWDTTYEAAPLRVTEVNTSAVMEGSRPRAVEDVLDAVAKYFADKFGKGYSERFYFVHQTVALQNLAGEDAQFRFAGWITLATDPGKRIWSEPQTLRLRPRETRVHTFIIDLPAGYSPQVMDEMSLKTCTVEASEVLVRSKREVVTPVEVRKRCNVCWP